ncbi:hypothetical protein Ana3638_02425 [Anaerocolumna sedimenticola]|uniref:Uncharacterized protein n=1 Tax=Anaerocolumna sedimenticola TaxID=2696063 RepID=A0A6P1TF36_9FIRM|nr:hypothetical protein [Anaerocolumna sedimenticola]QHQ59800.1 hypothetical protein Ana3638_02425 [Anaerocolumna sedimenticola]
MNIGFYACLILGLIFAIMTILFTLLGDKAAVLKSIKPNRGSLFSIADLLIGLGS